MLNLGWRTCRNQIKQKVPKNMELLLTVIAICRIGFLLHSKHSLRFGYTHLKFLFVKLPHFYVVFLERCLFLKQRTSSLSTSYSSGSYSLQGRDCVRRWLILVLWLLAETLFPFRWCLLFLGWEGSDLGPWPTFSWLSLPAPMLRKASTSTSCWEKYCVWLPIGF